MSDLFVEIIAPNGRKYTQPTGLFVNNEFVASSGQTITSIDPAFVSLPCIIDALLMVAQNR